MRMQCMISHIKPQIKIKHRFNWESAIFTSIILYLVYTWKLHTEMVKIVDKTVHTCAILHIKIYSDIIPALPFQRFSDGPDMTKNNSVFLMPSQHVYKDLISSLCLPTSARLSCDFPLVKGGMLRVQHLSANSAAM